jgi:hypothetical protein
LAAFCVAVHGGRYCCGGGSFCCSSTSLLLLAAPCFLLLLLVSFGSLLLCRQLLLLLHRLLPLQPLLLLIWLQQVHSSFTCLLLQPRLLQVLHMWCRCMHRIQLVWLTYKVLRQQQLERSWDQQDVRAQLTAAAAADVITLVNAAAAAAVWAGQSDSDGIVPPSHDSVVAAAEHLRGIRKNARFNACNVTTHAHGRRVTPAIT